ncbi:hypothetical protein PsYK624_040390 [Phanerochaete sordida]|uniref:Uncharacterized protein n=1 Tax=Phanerochaete sordida TaxID=48140 RepID=A0A9P3LA35_9APHY|nr:hypothetical protein PsYK624_040390 [Phanerochaete sordida]
MSKSEHLTRVPAGRGPQQRSLSAKALEAVRPAAAVPSATVSSIPSYHISFDDKALADHLSRKLASLHETKPLAETETKYYRNARFGSPAPLPRLPMKVNTSPPSRDQLHAHALAVSSPLIASPLTTADAVRTRFLLRKVLPDNVVHLILAYADRFYTISQFSGRKIAVDDDVLLLSISLTQAQCARIVQISLVIRGHDQGWLPTPAGSWRKGVSWTWYSVSTDDAPSPDRRLATNPAGDLETRTHAFNWDTTTDEVLKVKQSRQIRVWAHARYFGWRNVVEEAQIKIRFQPLGGSGLT